MPKSDRAYSRGTNQKELFTLMDTADPQQLNGYSYASNTPITASDPTGMFACDRCDGSESAPPDYTPSKGSNQQPTSSHHSGSSHSSPANTTHVGHQAVSSYTSGSYGSNSATRSYAGNVLAGHSVATHTPTPTFVKYLGFGVLAVGVVVACVFLCAEAAAAAASAALGVGIRVGATRVGAMLISGAPAAAAILDPNPGAGLGVASGTAKAEAGVVRHYTTKEAAESISKEGVLRPGSSGKTWLTTDRYASGAEARSGLALNKTPDGYFEVPMCRVQCASGPSRVEPFYRQPGGGTEITTEFPINVGGLSFNPFAGG